jgi:acetoacetyl-CoA reductase
MTLRIAYVTSGMGSVGTAICQKLARTGHTVVAGCAPNSPRKAGWLREQRELGFDFIASEGNAADWQSTVAAFTKVKAEVGEIDVLVNNAGGSRDVLFRQMTQDDWNAVMGSNLHALFNITKQVIDGMAGRGWGRIINIGSVSAHKGQIGQVNFATAKAAMHGFSRATSPASRSAAFRRMCWIAWPGRCRSAAWASPKRWPACAHGWRRMMRRMSPVPITP